MRKFLLLIYTVAVSLWCTSCGMELRYGNVPFEVNDIYYSVLDNAKVVENVYYSQSAFAKDFKAAVSGQETLGKLVDFDSHFAVTITDVVGDVMKDIEIVEVLERDYVLYVKFRIKEGKKVDYKVHPCMVASISREYDGYEVAFIDITDWK